MAKAIIFDLSEVLIAGLIGIEKELATLVNLSEEDFLEGLWTESFWDLMKGKISEDDYLADVFEKNNWNADKNVFKSAIRKNFHNEVDGMIELVEELSKEHKLILLSDHSEEWVTYIDQIYPFLTLFHKKYFSFQLGEIKREKKAFEILLSKNNLQPSDCLFIDDSPANVEAAKEVGLQAIQFQNADELKIEMGKYLGDIK